MRALIAGLILSAAPLDAAPAAVAVTATAYCRKGTTQSGTLARNGIVAADPKVFPVGSVLRIVDGPHAGVYTVMDTGKAVRGRRIDIFMPSCASADRFGEHRVHVQIIRRGWDPKS